IGLELHFDDDPQHRFALHEKDDEIGAVLSGLELSQIGGVSAYLVIVGQLDADDLQQLGREGWPIAKELNQHFMRERRHHGNVSRLLARLSHSRLDPRPVVSRGPDETRPRSWTDCPGPCGTLARA